MKSTRSEAREVGSGAQTKERSRVGMNLMLLVVAWPFPLSDAPLSTCCDESKGVFTVG